MQEPKITIDWEYAGPMDLTVGTGATFQEKVLTYASGIVLPLLYLFWYFTHRLSWSPWQYVLAGLIGADVGAGAVANALNSCKRFYLTPRRSDEPGWVGVLKNPYFFSALHIYPILAGFLFGQANGVYAFGWYTFLLAAVVLVKKTPVYLQRPVSALLLVLAFVMNAYLIQPVPGFEWLMPVLFVKIVSGHGVREEPYRPSPVSQTR